MNVSIPGLTSLNSTLPPFTWTAAVRDAGRLMPVVLIVVVLAALAVIAWFHKEKAPSETEIEMPQLRRSKKRGR